MYYQLFDYNYYFFPPKQYAFYTTFNFVTSFEVGRILIL